MTKLLRSLQEFMRDVIMALVRQQPLPEPLTSGEHRAAEVLTREVAAIHARGHGVELPHDWVW